jgi:hypothetical protein
MMKPAAIFKSRPAKLLFTISAVVISISILAYLVISQWDVIASQVWQIHWEFFALSFAFFSLDLLIIAQVWVWIINYLGARLSFNQQFRNFTISNLMRRLPGTIWYVAWRAQMYGQNGLSAGLVSLASGIELAINLVASMVVTVAFAIPLLIHSTTGIIIMLVLLILISAFFHPRLLGWLMRKAGSQATAINYRMLLVWIAFYVLARVIAGIIFFCIGRILTPIPFDQLGYMIGSHSLVYMISSALFFSPSNFGVTEVSLSLLLSAIMPSSIAVVVSVSNRIVTTALEIIWALLSLIAFKKDK